MIPYGRHCIEDDDIRAVEKALRSSHLTGGPTVEAFEERLAEVCGRKYAVAVNSGTAALYCMYRSVPWQCLQIPAITFAATATAAQSIIAAGRLDGDTRWIKFVEHYNSSPSPTGVRVVVDFAGLVGSSLPEDLIDAAHSLGALTSDGKPAPSRGVAAALSFHPCKAITTGEGGAVVTDEADIWQSVRELRDHGRVDGHVLRLSGNYRMSSMSAALGLSQLGKLDRFIAKRNEIAERYLKAFKSLPVKLPATAEKKGLHAWHLFVLRVDPKRRDVFREQLHKAGVGTQVHYRPVYQHPIFAGKHPVLPTAERTALSNVSIPLFPAMSDGEVAMVIRAVQEASRCL